MNKTRVVKALEAIEGVAKAFCPTGPGGGVDPTCSPNTGRGGSGGQGGKITTNNEGYGAWGEFYSQYQNDHPNDEEHAGAYAEQQFHEAGQALVDAFKVPPDAARDFLDSRMGRHLVDRTTFGEDIPTAARSNHGGRGPKTRQNAKVRTAIMDAHAAVQEESEEKALDRRQRMVKALEAIEGMVAEGSKVFCPTGPGGGISK